MELPEKIEFKPRSGMTCITVDGRSGLFVQTDDGLVVMYFNSEKKSYTSFDHFSQKLLKGERPYHLVAIYSGMNESPSYGLERAMTYLPRNTDDYLKVWSREKNSVKLNSSYTATIQDGKVVVGCQEIPFEAIEELAELIKKRR